MFGLIANVSRLTRTLCLAFAGVLVILLAVPQSFAQQEITVKEWDVPTPGSNPHDIVVDGNGIVWYTAIGANKIGRFDPTSEQFQEFNIPTPSSRPHGLVADESGNIWFTEQRASKIGKLDPATGKIQEFPTPTANSGPHTPIMGDGALWFTEQSASKIAKLDVATGEIEEFPTPTPRSSPYGIILDADGNPWYAALSAHRIAMVDAQTGEITEHPTPTDGSGTRRIAIDSKGKLWFTEYNVGKIGSYDPATGEFQEYDTESASSGPYAIWVDIHDNVWFSLTSSHKIGRFDQDTGTLHEYDMPTPNTTSRFIYADSEGRVWFPNDVNDKIGVITLESAESLAHARFEPERDLQEDPVTLSYNITHMEKQDGIHTIIELALTDDNKGGEPVQHTAYFLEVVPAGDSRPILADGFYDEDGTITLDIFHTGSIPPGSRPYESPEIQGVKQEFLNAWMANPETGVISMELPMQSDSAYVLRLEIFATDNIEDLYPATRPEFELFFEGENPVIGEIQIVPEFPYTLILLISVMIGIIIVLNRSGLTTRISCQLDI